MPDTVRIELLAPGLAIDDLAAIVAAAELSEAGGERPGSRSGMRLDAATGEVVVGLATAVPSIITALLLVWDRWKPKPNDDAEGRGERRSATIIIEGVDHDVTVSATDEGQLVDSNGHLLRSQDLPGSAAEILRIRLK